VLPVSITVRSETIFRSGHMAIQRTMTYLSCDELPSRSTRESKRSRLVGGNVTSMFPSAL